MRLEKTAKLARAVGQFFKMPPVVVDLVQLETLANGYAEHSCVAAGPTWASWHLPLLFMEWDDWCLRMIWVGIRWVVCAQLWVTVLGLGGHAPRA